MRTLFIIPLVLMSLVLTVSPVYSMNFLCGSVGFGCETLTRDDLVKKDDLYFKKFTNVPFTGNVEGEWQGTFNDGIPEGPWKGFLKDGTIWEEFTGTFKNGVKVSD